MSDAIREAFEAIEQSVACGDMSAAQVFTQMRQIAMAALQSSQTAPAVPEVFDFIYVHPGSGEKEIVVVTRETVAERMSDYLNDMLAQQVCKCQPVGETNVVDCGCEEYFEGFVLHPAAPQPDHSPDAGKVVQAKALEWSDHQKPNNQCSYDHVTADTPFGRFLITWKSWKEYDDPTIDETPWGEFGGVGCDLADAKNICEREYLARLRASQLEGGEG